MISCLLIHVTRSQSGSQTRNEIRIEGEPIELGRGSSCQIHLPDHRVSLSHARIKRTADGKLHIEATHDALISINGFMEHSTELVPGMQIGIGPYLLTIEASDADTDLVLSVDTHETHDEHSVGIQNTGLTLSVLNINKRRLGFGLATFILMALFTLPLLSRVFPAFENWQAKLPFAVSELLSPGPLSAGHEMFGAKCSSCHQNAFQAVADSICTDCHKNVATHLAADHPFHGALTGARCADCHPAHQGKADATKEGSTDCLNCHKQTDKGVAEVKDFAAGHPSFHLLIPSGRDNVRVEQDAKEMPPEKSGIKFSHQLHLDKKGISTPNGDTVMVCRDCHQLEDSGIHFAPMEMEMTCQQSRCHKIRHTEPVYGLVPHGSEREVMNFLRNFYAKYLADTPQEILMRCGSTVSATGNIVQRAWGCADLLARQHAAATLFRETGENLECALCHEISQTVRVEDPWNVTPVRRKHDWQPKAVFNHAKHATSDCTVCHDKADSKISEDVSFPNIEKCRECHAGTAGSPRQIASSCKTCHRFHRFNKE
ncbi:MAG: cytochrome c3 family protein [Rhodocyclaceae bacterium]|nr:cytochrome c3 family protein [Rhodocyclaceae bacterium]MDZ4213672.1 cytochrome c3 family protein [Rhodocyclaceae bacterium]